VVCRVSDQLTGEDVAEMEALIAADRKATNCLGQYRFDSATPYWEEDSDAERESVG